MATRLGCYVACPGHDGVAEPHKGEDVENHLIEDAVRQRMLAVLGTVPYMPFNHLDRLCRLVCACFVAMRANLTWAELGGVVSPADGAGPPAAQWNGRVRPTRIVSSAGSAWAPSPS